MIGMYWGSFVMIIGIMQDLLHVEENFECFKTKSTLKVLGNWGQVLVLLAKLQWVDFNQSSFVMFRPKVWEKLNLNSFCH